MIRAVVLYESEPEAGRYATSWSRSSRRRSPAAAFRHGKALGAPVRRARLSPTTPSSSGLDRDSFKAATRSEEFAASGKDAMGMGIPFSVTFVELRDRARPPRPLPPKELGFERIVYEKASPRATVTLNRPEVLNAFDFRMLRELARAFEDASWDDEIRVVVVTGTARVLRRRRPASVGRGPARQLEGVLEVVRRLQGHARPAARDRQADRRAREGIAVGGGNELQMACDLAVMVEDAFIRHVGLEHGSVPAGGATQWLPIMVGDRRARELILLCEEIPAPQAAEWGLDQSRRPRGRARRGRRRVGREARPQAPRDDAVREAAAELVARRLLARDGRPRPRLARDVDARRRGAGRGAAFLDARR